MLKDVMTGSYVKNGESFGFEFATDLSTVDKLKFVKSVVGLVIDDLDYNSVIRDLVTDFYIVDIFTDVDTADLKDSPYFIDDVEEFLEDNNIVDIVKANAKYGLFEELNKAIDENIEYRTGIHKNVLNEALASLVNTLENKLNQFDVSGMSEMIQAFSGISGDFTPENIVNAYMKTDMAKKNVDELKKSKKSKKSNVIDIADKK